MSEILQGVKCVNWRGSQARARHLARTLASSGQVAYWVMRPQEQRDATRARTRLRSAKILDCSHRFLSECRIHDSSIGGVRLALQRAVGLPQRFLVHDDDSGEVRAAMLVWRRGAELGARWAGAPTRPLTPSQGFALKGRYYAMRA
jgi:hypothetical protein